MRFYTRNDIGDRELRHEPGMMSILTFSIIDIVTNYSVNRAKKESTTFDQPLSVRDLLDPSAWVLGIKFETIRHDRSGEIHTIQFGVF
jgi:hypothetical protein